MVCGSCQSIGWQSAQEVAPIPDNYIMERRSSEPSAVTEIHKTSGDEAVLWRMDILHFSSLGMKSAERLAADGNPLTRTVYAVFVLQYILCVLGPMSEALVTSR